MIAWNEFVQKNACKRFMNVSQRVCNAAILGDCNRFPLHIETAKQAMKYWFKILKMCLDRNVKKWYLMFNLMKNDKHGQRNWVSELREMLCKNGFAYIWNSQDIRNKNMFLTNSERRLKDNYIQN